MKKYLILIAAAIFNFSCSHEPVRQSGLQKAKWETKLQMKDLERQALYPLYADIIGFKNEKMRIEFSAILGLPVATLVLNKGSFQAIVYKEKKYYAGKLDDQTLQKILKVPMSAQWIYAIAFDENIRGANWNCETSMLEKTSAPQACVNNKMGYEIQWSRKDDATKLVHVKTQKIEVNWYFQAPVTEFEDKPESYELKVPEGFQVIKS